MRVEIGGGISILSSMYLVICATSILFSYTFNLFPKI